MTEQDVELVARALFEREQSGLFPPKMFNQMMYGQEVVTWEFINDEQFVKSCSDRYRDMAKAAIAAMPNKHEKALEVARHKIGAALLLATPDHDVPQDSRNMIYTQEANAIRRILSDALATIDEIVGK